MGNLEPVEDADLDLQGKFLGKSEAEKNIEAKTERNKEAVPVPEKFPEKKEGAAEKEKAYSRILSKIKNHHPSPDDLIADDAKETSAEETAKAKVDKLVKLATNKGVVHAVKVARHLDDNYALDEFHGRLLADDLHDALVEKGLIKEL